MSEIEEKVLVERLREKIVDTLLAGLPYNRDGDEAANRIEALEAENERLREALGWILNDSRFVVQVGGNPNVVPQMIEAARAALGDTFEDFGQEFEAVWDANRDKLYEDNTK